MVYFTTILLRSLFAAYLVRKRDTGAVSCRSTSAAFVIVVNIYGYNKSIVFLLATMIIMIVIIA